MNLLAVHLDKRVIKEKYLKIHHKTVQDTLWENTFPKYRKTNIKIQ